MTPHEQPNSAQTSSGTGGWSVCAVIVMAIIYGFIQALGLTARVGETSYPILFDDALISMRYAHNLSQGFYWSWNPGDPPLEGFTNLGWVLLLTLWQGLLADRVLAAWWVLGQGLVLHGVLAASVLAITAYLAPGRAALAAGCAMACTWPVAFWSLSGLEVPAMALLTLTAAGLLVHKEANLTQSSACQMISWVLGLLALLLILIRSDGVIPVAGVFFASVIHGFRTRKWLPAIAVGVGAAVAILGTTAFRLSVFGQPVPNTYFLKMEGFPGFWRITRGTIQTGWQLAVGFLFPWLLIAGIIGLRPSCHRVLKLGLTHPVLPLVCGLSFAYSCFVGGDAWEGSIPLNRFVVTAYPLLLVWGVASLDQPNWNLKWLLPMTTAVFLAFGPSVFPTRDWAGAAGRWVGVKAAPGTELHGQLLSLIPDIRDTVPTTATMAVAHAGTIPYYGDGRYLDLLGKCDAVIAREPMHRGVMTQNPLMEFFPGHLKWNYDYSLGTLRPDYILSQWGKTRPFAEPYLKNYELIKQEGPIQLWRRRP